METSSSFFFLKNVLKRWQGYVHHTVNNFLRFMFSYFPIFHETNFEQ